MIAAGRCTLVKAACYNGEPVDRVEIHPGKGFRIISIANGDWYQTTKLSRRALYLRDGVKLTFRTAPRMGNVSQLEAAQ